MTPPMSDNTPATPRDCGPTPADPVKTVETVGIMEKAPTVEQVGTAEKVATVGRASRPSNGRRPFPSPAAASQAPATRRLTAAALLIALLALLPLPANVHADENQPGRDDRPAQAAEDDDADNRREHDRDRDRSGNRDGRRTPPPFYGPPRTQPLDTPLDEDRVEHILSLMEDMQPGSTERLRDLREENPERFESFIAHVGPHTLYMDHLRQHDPHAYELRREEQQLGMKAMHLAHQARTADEDEAKQAHRDELREVLARQFEIRTELLEHEMEQVETRLEHLRSQIAEQRDRREHFIDRRLEMIMKFRGPRRGPNRDRDDDDDDDDDRAADASTGSHDEKSPHDADEDRKEAAD